MCKLKYILTCASVQERKQEWWRDINYIGFPTRLRSRHCLHVCQHPINTDTSAYNILQSVGINYPYMCIIWYFVLTVTFYKIFTFRNRPGKLGNMACSHRSKARWLSPSGSLSKPFPNILFSQRGFPSGGVTSYSHVFPCNFNHISNKH